MKGLSNTVLITNGGVGTGRALARRFADLDNTVIVPGRSADALAETVVSRSNTAAAVVNVDDPVTLAAFASELCADYPARSASS